MTDSTKLINNSKITNEVFETESGIVKGFDVVNPNGSKVHIDLSQYVSKSHEWYQSESTPELRREVYTAYKALVENVPAATPLFENIAENFPQGISHEKSDYLGAFNNSPGKNSSNTSSPLDTPIVILGNISLPKMNGHDQPGKYYMGVDRQWHTNSPVEVLLHELGHSSSKLQNWTPAGIALYNQDLAQGIAPKDEKRTMEFLSTVLRVPIGKVAEDLESYSLKRPDNLVPAPNPPKDFEGLRHGQIPKLFEEYSQPKVVPVAEQSLINTTTNEKLATIEGELLNVRTQSPQVNQIVKAEISNQDKIAIAAQEIGMLPKQQQVGALVRLEEIAAKLNVPINIPKNESATELQYNV